MGWTVGLCANEPGAGHCVQKLTLHVCIFQLANCKGFFPLRVYIGYVDLLQNLRVVPSRLCLNHQCAQIWSARDAFAPCAFFSLFLRGAHIVLRVVMLSTLYLASR